MTDFLMIFPLKAMNLKDTDVEKGNGLRKWILND
jgi:hypothetical protein